MVTGDRGPGPRPDERGRGRRQRVPRRDRSLEPYPACDRSSPAGICSMASGCAARAGAPTRATQLRTAHEMLDAIGMEAFAERARRELLATGEKVRKRTVDTRDELTGQERQIAGLARDGLSNPEIGARLFLSSRTVEWHLGKVFAKLGISSRMGLARGPAEPRPGSHARIGQRRADGEPVSPTRAASTSLRGRASECAVLDGLIADDPPGRESVAGPAGRGRDREDGAAGVPDRVGVGPDGRAGGGGGVGDGAGVRQPASAVRRRCSIGSRGFRLRSARRWRSCSG